MPQETLAYIFHQRTPSESRITMTIDVRQELQKLISFDTVSDAKAGKHPSQECPRHINAKLEQFGFITDLLESDGIWTSFARRGQGRFKVLFLAHYDVVPIGEGWKSDPFKLVEEGDKATGRGSCDDKGNIVSLISLAEKLSTIDPPFTVMLAVTGDEEIGGEKGAGHLKQFLMKQGLFPNYVVVADGINQMVIHRRRNVLPTNIKVKRAASKVKGRRETVRFVTETLGTETRHSAYFRPGVDRHAMLAASKYLSMHQHALVSGLRGGFVKSNVIPQWVELDVVHTDEPGEEVECDRSLTSLLRSLLTLAHASFPTKHSDLGTFVSPNLLSLDSNLWTLYCDVRAMTDDRDAVRSAFETALRDKVELYSLQVEPGSGYVDSKVDSRLIRSAIWALRKEGIDYLVGEGYGASDSRYFTDPAVQVFDFGPRGDNVHGPNEWVSLTSIEQNAAFFRTLLDVLSSEGPPSGSPSRGSSRP